MRMTDLAYAIHYAFNQKMWPTPHHLKHTNWMNIR